MPIGRRIKVGALQRRDSAVDRAFAPAWNACECILCCTAESHAIVWL
jgi:hypothetical protein